MNYLYMYKNTIENLNIQDVNFDKKVIWQIHTKAEPPHTVTIWETEANYSGSQHNTPASPETHVCHNPMYQSLRATLHSLSNCEMDQDGFLLWC